MNCKSCITFFKIIPNILITIILHAFVSLKRYWCLLLLNIVTLIIEIVGFLFLHEYYNETSIIFISICICCYGILLILFIYSVYYYSKTYVCPGCAAGSHEYECKDNAQIINEAHQNNQMYYLSYVAVISFLINFLATSIVLLIWLI